MLANQAAQSGWPHAHYLAALPDGEATLRRQRSIKRRIKLAGSINRAAVQNLFRLKFIDDRTNVILLGGVGLERLTLPPPSAMPPASRKGDPYSSPRPLTPSTPCGRHVAQAANRLKCVERNMV